MRARLLPVLCLLAAPALAGGHGAGTVVLLPFLNLSGVEGAPQEIARPLAREISARGWEVVRGERVESLLAAARVRFLDSLGSSDREELLAKLGADAVISGTVYRYASGENPAVALFARLLSADGRTVWSEVVGITSGDTEGLLALGRAPSLESLASKAVGKLLADFPRPGRTVRTRGHGTPLTLKSPPTFKSAALAVEGVARVCLLPFDTFASARESSRVLSELLAHELAASGRFEVVEPAELRAALVAEKIHGVAAIEPDRLAALGRRLGTSLFLRGTVYVYQDSSPRSASLLPELDVEVVLEDVESGRILWMSSNARKGRDYRGFLQRGAPTTLVALSTRVFGEMVSAEKDATLREIPAGFAARFRGAAPREVSVRAARTP